MQRRTTAHRSSSRLPSTSLPQNSDDEANEKNKGRIIRTQTLCGGLIVLVVLLFCIGALLTPSQKHDLIKMEKDIELDLIKIEEDIESGLGWTNKQQSKPVPKQPPQTPNIRKTDAKKQTETKEDAIQKVPPPQQPKQKKEQPKKQTPKDEQQQQQQQQKRVDPSQKTINLNRASSDAATARMEAQSSRWVDGEKALKKKLNVLFEQQMKGQNLGVPVLTRYLGEDIPAFVGTPDSTLKEEEWKKLVEAKYEEMRQEEEEWQTKMKTMIEQRTRDMGITTA